MVQLTRNARIAKQRDEINMAFRELASKVAASPILSLRDRETVMKLIEARRRHENGKLDQKQAKAKETWAGGDR
jgi:hypothetical protein